MKNQMIELIAGGKVWANLYEDDAGVKQLNLAPDISTSEIDSHCGGLRPYDSEGRALTIERGPSSMYIDDLDRKHLVRFRVAENDQVVDVYHPLGETSGVSLRKRLGRRSRHASIQVNLQITEAVEAFFSGPGNAVRCQKHVNPHCFRHSAATHMLENGADLKTIQTLPGHATILTTEIYTHVGTKKLKTVHSNTHPRVRGVKFCLLRPGWLQRFYRQQMDNGFWR